jgi:hypothetical protein
MLAAEKLEWMSERDSLLSDFRMREVQLKNINKVNVLLI